MRILAVGNMYPPHHLGGYELVWRAAMRHLREHGHTARVLTTAVAHTKLIPRTLAVMIAVSLVAKRNAVEEDARTRYLSRRVRLYHSAAQTRPSVKNTSNDSWMK